MPPTDRGVPGSETIDGTAYTSDRYELAAYAQRAGNVEIPGFPVRFEAKAQFLGPTKSYAVVAPPVSFTAKMPPGTEGLSTVITTRGLTLKESWQPEPRDALIGAAFTRTITIDALDVPGMVLPAFRSDTPEGLRAYAKPPEVEDRAERGELTGRRVERVTYVCERAGTFSLPALVLMWWDPQEKKLKRVELPARMFEVTAPPQPPTAVVQHTPATWRSWPWIVAAIVGVAVVGVVAWRLGLIVWAWSERRQAAAAEYEATYFAAFERACHNGDPHAIHQALFAWLDRFLANDPAPSAESFVTRASDPELTEDLSGLEDALYGRMSDRSKRWSAGNLLRKVRRARSRLRLLRTPDHGRRCVLPPLNP